METGPAQVEITKMVLYALKLFFQLVSDVRDVLSAGRTELHTHQLQMRAGIQTQLKPSETVLTSELIKFDFVNSLNNPFEKNKLI